MNGAQAKTLFACALGVCLVAPRGGFEAPYRLIYNPSSSAPRGWYWLNPATQIRVADYVLARLPLAAAKLADERQYLPRSVPILKRVGAVGKQRVCVTNSVTSIDSMTIARSLSRDGAGRPLASWNECRALQPDEFFLLSLTNKSSFDSRYFGPIRSREVIGIAQPLWTW